MITFFPVSNVPRVSNEKLSPLASVRAPVSNECRNAKIEIRNPKNPNLRNTFHIFAKSHCFLESGGDQLWKWLFQHGRSPTTNTWTFSTATPSLERSENTLFWKLQKAHMVYGPRHNTDFRTIDEIIIGWISFCEIGKTFLTDVRNVCPFLGKDIHRITISSIVMESVLWRTPEIARAFCKTT